MRHSRRWNATLEMAQRGEVKHLRMLKQLFDLPGRADYLR